MLIAPGGGGGTDWSAMNVVQMWALVANQDTAPHYQLLTGWRKSYELMIEHLRQMQNYRDNLVSAWPPEKSPAAAAYVTQLDDMISHLQKTYDAAVANHTAFAGATLSLSIARADLKTIYDEYTSNRDELARFDAKPKPVQYGKVPVAPEKPPVDPSRQEELNNQARLLMSKLSTDLVQAQTSFTTPAKFTPPYLVGEKKTPEQTGTPFPVPPGGGLDVDTTVGLAISGGGGQRSVEPSASGPGAATVLHAGQSQQPGLVLGGTNAPSAAPPSITTPPSSPAPSPTASGGPLPGGIGQPTNLPPTTLPTVTSKPNTSALPRSVSSEGASHVVPFTEPVQGVRAMPSGGVIGGAMPVPSAQTATSRISPQRVNPVGGVIGNGSQQATGSRGGTSKGQGLAPLTGGRGRRSKIDQQAKWDPDNPWRTDEGVDPIVLPVAEQRIDPGPAIGLS